VASAPSGVLASGLLTGVLAAVLLMALGGCNQDGDGNGVPPATTASAPGTVPSTSSVPALGVLTVDQPTARFEPTIDGRPEVLELRIDPVTNPARSAFVVRVVLETGDGDRTEYHLGQVATFPADEPGIFALRVPDDAVRALVGGGPAATIVLRLEAVAADMPLPTSLRVSVASATLRGG